MGTDDPAGRTAAPTPHDDALIGRLVAAHVASIDVPPGLSRRDWRSRRRAEVRLLGADRGPGGVRGLAPAGAAAAAVLALALVASLAGRVPPSPSAPAAGAASPSAPPASEPSHAATKPASPSPAGPAQPAGLGASAWFSMSAFGGCPGDSPPEPLSACSGSAGGRPGSIDLFVGTLDGMTTLHVSRSLPQSARLWSGRGSLPSASGPFGGQVLYWLYDGTRSELHLVDAATGADSTVATSGDVVYNAVYDPASRTVYYGLLDAARRRDLGVWEVRLDGARAPTQLLPPPLEGHTYSGPLEWGRTLLLTPDGSRLVVRDCEGGTCAVGVYASIDGRLAATAERLRDDAVYGLTNDALFGILGCTAGRCGVSELDLATGAVRGLTDDPCAVTGSGVVAARDDGSPVLLLAAPAGCGAGGTVNAVDLSTGSAGPVWAPAAPDAATGAVLELATQAQGFQGYTAPRGWMLVAPSGELPRTNQTGSLVPEVVSLSSGAAYRVSVQPGG